MHFEFLRRNLATHPALVVCLLASTCLSSACRSTPSTQPAPVSADTWAVVDGRAIKEADVEKAFRRARDVSQTLSEEETLTAKLGLLNDLIVEDILLTKASELKIEVPESELEKAYTDAKGRIPDDAFQQELTRRNLTAADMRDGLRRDLLTRKVIEREIGPRTAVTDQQVTDFFNANRAQFNLAEDAYHVAQIVITAGRDAQIANRTGDDATTPEAATQKVAMIMERLKTGATFTDLAMDYSEDPQSAPRGGDLGFMPVSTLRQAPPALRDAVLNVPPGSARVVSGNGTYTVVFVVARETAGQRELTTPGVRERITDTLRQRREQLMRTAYLTASQNRASITNYLARRVAEQGKP